MIRNFFSQNKNNSINLVVTANYSTIPAGGGSLVLTAKYGNNNVSSSSTFTVVSGGASARATKKNNTTFTISSLGTTVTDKQILTIQCTYQGKVEKLAINCEANTVTTKETGYKIVVKSSKDWNGDGTYDMWFHFTVSNISMNYYSSGQITQGNIIDSLRISSSSYDIIKKENIGWDSVNYGVSGGSGSTEYRFLFKNWDNEGWDGDPVLLVKVKFNTSSGTYEDDIDLIQYL